MNKNTERHFTYERIVDEEVMEKDWFPLLQEIFPDPGDQESLELLKARLALKNYNYFVLVRNSTKKRVGILLVQTDPFLSGPIYIPWGGVIQRYRNASLFPSLLKKVLIDPVLKKRRVTYMLHECEDPAHVNNLISSLGLEPQSQEAKLLPSQLKRRINFFRREIGSYFVDDADVRYVRPASDDEKRIQAYDLLAVTIINSEDQELLGLFNNDMTAISKSGYHRLYLEAMLLQYSVEGNTLSKKEQRLREYYPAIEQFLNQLENSPKQWFTIIKETIKPRSHPSLFKAKVDGSL